MADDKKNIPDVGKVDNPPEPGKVEPVKAAPPVQDQPAPAKADASVVEGAPKVATPPAAEQPAPADKEAPKDKDAPAPSMEGTPQPGKDEKQTTIPGMGDPAPAGKVVDFTATRDGAAKGKPPEKAAAPDKGKQADKAKDVAKPRRGRPARADKAFLQAPTAAWGNLWDCRAALRKLASSVYRESNLNLPFGKNGKFLFQLGYTPVVSDMKKIVQKAAALSFPK